ncbi:hypothetical protein AWW67_12325 [Roseivirga seohaensis]|uniref:Glycosyltransferase subfamily 4-like N-terminal domain-containing protein n=1 Tax=Roseivirga seohaensis TaxID=1914963 RepID=A0A150XMX2_9BACT|nr:hypothetical protein [Roseivirga seohaensis]KYG80080.1 hypothetical protein AWW67_12325 [Roseivirga seohaensis]
MKRALVLSFSDLKYDARVTRQIKWLSTNYEVTVVCFGERLDIENIQYEVIQQIPLTPIKKLLLAISLALRFYNLAYSIQHGYLSVLKRTHLPSFDLIIANDIEALPLALKLKQSAKVFFDAHEYAPRHFEDKLWWKLLFGPWYRHLCEMYILKANIMTTVCSGLANEYMKEFGVKPVVITNATRYYSLETTKVEDTIKMVHHGIINKSRKIENMISLMGLLGDGYHLDLILMLPEYASESTAIYFDNLKAEITKTSNIRILPPLPNEEIVPAINKYDIGLFLLEPINFNYTHALPNKLFDFIQGRLAIAIGPSPEMARIVKKYELGVISSNFSPESLAESIKNLSKRDIEVMKANSSKHALMLSEEHNKEVFLSLLKKLFT